MGCNEMKDKKKEPINIKNPSTNPNLDNLDNERNQIKESNISKNQKDILNRNLPIKDDIKSPEFKDEVDNSPKQEQINFDNHSIVNDGEEEIKKDFLKSINNNFKENENVKNLLEIDDQDYCPDYIGKLCFNPLILFIYDCKKKAFHSRKYETLLQNFEKLNSSASCCNGDNKLFVSGGTDRNENSIDNLWIFNLLDYNVDESIKVPGKANHSMIFIPKKYIFFIGGNDKKVFYLDINDKKVENWSELNNLREEPALIQVNNYLYVFNKINKNEMTDNYDLSLEKTNLLSNEPTWELIHPELSNEILGVNIIPKFFGVARESEDNIIFLGGNILDKNDNLDEVKNFRYNINNNLIEFSDVPFVNISLKEKHFLSFKNDVYLILPDFYQKCPQVAFYVKNKKMIKVIDYRPNIKKGGKEIIDNPIIKEDIKNYDFNMPKIQEKMENEIIAI